jgi:type IV pilus assembly protein PilN
MKIPINLASQPFRRGRALLVASVLVCLMLVGTLGVLISLANADSKQLVDVRREISQLEAQIRKVEAGQAQQDAFLRQPANADVLERSVFINALLLRKGISWTRILADMEKVLPYNVRIIQIHPTLTGSNQVLLDMTVGSETQPPVIEFLQALEKSPLFGSVLDHSFLPPTQSEPIYRNHVSVIYAQKL